MTVSAKSAREPDRVLAARERPAVEPAPAGEDLESGLLQERTPLGRSEPRQRHRRRAGVAAHRERERARVLVPVGALEDARLALDPAPVRLLDVVSGGLEDVEGEAAVGDEQRPGRSQRPQALRVVSQVEEGAERARHEPDALLHRRILQVADAQIEELRHARALRRLAADGQHPGRRVDSDHGYARSRGRHGDAPGADGQLDDGTARLDREVDVEADVLGDAPAPRVVEPRDRVVERHGGRWYKSRMDWQAYREEALAAYASASALDELTAVNVRFAGRKSPLKLALRDVRDRETGRLLNDLRSALEEAEHAAAQRIAAAQAAEHAGEPFDPTLPGEEIPRGSLHLISQLRRRIEDVFLGLGYQVFDGREVETVWHNFDALNQPEAHPSRDPQDTFYFDESTLLRTHTSPSQIRAMMEQDPPVYLVSLGRCYRRDALDPTHTPVFHQVEALAVDRNITLADLRGTVQSFVSAIFGGQREVRMRTSFFPFTEPSVEFDMTCYLCDGQGCRVCGHSGWIEMGGAGEVDPAVFEAVGYDPDEWQGFAWGLGIDRIAFNRHGLPDLRLFWENDIRFLRQF